MKSAPLFLCAALLCGCAAQGPLAQRAPATQVFHDELFQPSSTPIDTSSVFAVTPAMKTYLHNEIQQNLHGKDPRRVLFEALYQKGKLKLEYDSAMTRNAAQTFEARAGNCLSLAIMTAALARELNLTVRFQLVQIDDSWTRSGNLYFANNHVNLALGNPRADYGNGYSVYMSNALTVDFIPISPKVREMAQPLEETTIVAMYLNNRAAELLAQGHLDDAYWLARRASMEDPNFVNAYNTLAVIYQHHGNLPQAEQALRQALLLAPDNTIYLSNLIPVLEVQNKGIEAGVLRQRLAALEPNPPFHFFNLGQEAMRRGDYAHARELFERELERAPDYHEFHFWYAVAAYQMGDLKTADAHMAKAMVNSTTRGDHDLYAAKLDRIRAYEAHTTTK